eukprot:sb/3475060/
MISNDRGEGVLNSALLLSGPLTTWKTIYQEPTETIKQPLSYLGHVTGYQPTRDQYFLIRSVPVISQDIIYGTKLMHQMNSKSLPFTSSANLDGTLNFQITPRFRLSLASFWFRWCRLHLVFSFLGLLIRN